MELHFKEASGNTNEGDVVWIHSSGRQALIADIVSGCEVDKGVDLLGSWLCLNEAEDIFSATWLTEQLHLLLQRSGVQATIGIITKHANEFVLNLVGNIRLYRVESAVTKVAEAGFEIQPTSVIGSEYTPIVKTVTVKTSPHVKYILASDGLDSESMCGLALNADALNSGAMRSKLLPAACDGDWSALIFPMAQSHTFVDEDWPYNPFVGHQEDRIHERRGLSELATALFSDPLFEGFRIVSCPPILGPSSSRLFDGLLVYPFGVIPLELKDHHGEITVEIGTNRRNSLRVKNERGENYFTSPVVKLRESLRRFGDLPQLRGLQTECKNAGLVIFTANHVSVNCGLDGDFIPAPFKGAGEIMVAKTKQVPDLLKDFVRSRFGKKLVPKLSDSDINRLVNAITAVSDEPEQYHQPMLQIGDYCVDIVPINDESSDYYRVFKAQLFNEQVWAKCYCLDHLSPLEREAQLKSLGREALVLKRLGRVNGVQRYQDKELVDDKYYIFVEKAPKLTLIAWVQSNPCRQERLKLLVKIAQTIEQIQKFDDPVIIHRAINPSNIRIDADGDPMLINFELCQHEMVATLPLNARRTFEQNYQAPEVNRPGSSLTYAADIFSLGLIIYFTLTAKLPFVDPSEVKQFTNKRPIFWKKFCQELGISTANAEFWQRILHPTSNYRPSIEQVLENITQWK